MSKRLATCTAAFFAMGALLMPAIERASDRAAKRQTPTQSTATHQSSPAVPGAANDAPPSDEELRERAKKLVANQHKNDAALDEYERVERYIDRTAGANPQLLLDKTFRMVPTGGGTMKMQLKEHGMPIDPALYQRQLKTLRDILAMMSNPDDPKAKAAYDKYQKRKQDRDTFVDVAENAFIVKWLGRETRNGRMCEVFQLDPNPNFHPHTLFQDALAHVTAKIWVDPATTELVHAEAQALTDIYFGGGILGKLARGSNISMDQEPVAPGIWEATHMEYNYSGRKFLFPFEQHQEIEAGHYTWIGPPKEALASVQQELSGGKPFAGDP